MVKKKGLSKDKVIHTNYTLMPSYRLWIETRKHAQEIRNIHYNLSAERERESERERERERKRERERESSFCSKNRIISFKMIGQDWIHKTDHAKWQVWCHAIPSMRKCEHGVIYRYMYIYIE